MKITPMTKEVGDIMEEVTANILQVCTDEEITLFGIVYDDTAYAYRMVEIDGEDYRLGTHDLAAALTPDLEFASPTAENLDAQFSYYVTPEQLRLPEQKLQYFIQQELL